MRQIVGYKVSWVRPHSFAVGPVGRNKHGLPRERRLAGNWVEKTFPKSERVQALELEHKLNKAFELIGVYESMVRFENIVVGED